MQKDACAMCGGSGSVTDKFCGGSGKDPVESLRGVEVCSNCGGAGEITCPACKGSGKLE